MRLRARPCMSGTAAGAFRLFVRPRAAPPHQWNPSRPHKSPWTRTRLSAGGWHDSGAICVSSVATNSPHRPSKDNRILTFLLGAPVIPVFLSEARVTPEYWWLTVLLSGDCISIPLPCLRVIWPNICHVFLKVEFRNCSVRYFVIPAHIWFIYVGFFFRLGVASPALNLVPLFHQLLLPHQSLRNPATPG